MFEDPRDPQTFYNYIYIALYDIFDLMVTCSLPHFVALPACHPPLTGRLKRRITTGTFAGLPFSYYEIAGPELRTTLTVNSLPISPTQHDRFSL